MAILLIVRGNKNKQEASITNNDYRISGGKDAAIFSKIKAMGL